MLLHTWAKPVELRVDHADWQLIRISDGQHDAPDDAFSLTLSQAEARDLLDKLSAALDAVEPQRVAA